MFLDIGHLANFMFCSFKLILHDFLLSNYSISDLKYYQSIVSIVFRCSPYRVDRVLDCLHWDRVDSTVDAACAAERSSTDAPEVHIINF